MVPCQSLTCPEHFESYLFTRKTDYVTSNKMKICFEINVNDQMYSKHATILAITNKPSKEHFIEFKFDFNTK